MKKKKWKVILCVVLAAVVLGGSLTVWRLCFPPDTNPNAPFRDLPNWEKQKILSALEEYYITDPPQPRLCWFGETNQHFTTPAGKYGVQYYGTFGGYHIILSPRQAMAALPDRPSVSIGGYTFSYSDIFILFGYKDGKVIPLEELYLNPLSKEQIGQIYQCYEQYPREVYRCDYT